MVPVAQKVKRVFHATVGVGLMMTRPFGLTPSRYELMSALKSQRQIWYPQRALQHLLGIAASTLSRMVDGLVQRGYLRRKRDPEDGRCNLLRQTFLGKRAFVHAFRTYVKSGFAEYVFGRGLTDSLDGDIAALDKRTSALHEAEQMLHPIHLNFGKDAYFDYDGKVQPRPVGPIYYDAPPCDIWDNDEPRVSKFLAAAAAYRATSSTRTYASSSR